MTTAILLSVIKRFLAIFFFLCSSILASSLHIFTGSEHFFTFLPHLWVADSNETSYPSMSSVPTPSAASSSGPSCCATPSLLSWVVPSCGTRPASLSSLMSERPWWHSGARRPIECQWRRSTGSLGGRPNCRVGILLGLLVHQFLAR
jgi:hypothetical protein